MVYRPLAPYAFFDESGKWKDKDFICLCGYLSGASAWGKYTDEWTALLREKGFASIHFTKFFYECKRRGLDATQVTAIIEEFIDIIRKRIWLGFAIGFDAKHYRRMPSHARKAIGDPAMLCLQRLMKQIRERFHTIGYEGRIAITLDEDEEYVDKTYRTIQRLRRHDKVLGRLIGSVAFADDEFIVPLQAADIVANLTSKWFRDRMSGKATANAPPELLNRLLMAPGNRKGLEYCTELWDGDALDANWRQLVRD
jgi:hypothetical protein